MIGGKSARTLALAALAGLAAPAAGGCGGAIRMAPCPAEGGPPWQEVRSPHFSVRTDLPLAEARTVALELEGLRAAILAAAWPELELAETMEVVVLRERREFTALFGERLDGFVAWSDWPLMVIRGSAEPWIYGRGTTRNARPSIVAHELAHYISGLAGLPQPPWLSEGLASFLETVELSEDRSTATIGRLNLPRLESFRRQRGYSMRDALTWKRDPGHRSDNQAFYAASWILVHWLYNTRPEAFVKYQSRLLRGDDESSAWRESFPGLDLEALDRQLSAYATNGQYERTDVVLRFSDPALTVAQVAEAEVHAIRARLGQLSSRMDRAEARAFAAAELKAALSSDPDNLTALLVAFDNEDTPGVRLMLARRAAASHPGSAQAWLRLGMALQARGGPADEAERAYRKTLELSPHQPTALRKLAFLYVSQGRMQEALPLSTKAVELDPAPGTLGAHALALAGNGRCGEARSFHRRSVASSPAPDADEKRRRDRLRAAIERRCAPPPPQP
jgi:Flp pilus assembly protein TadD